LRRAVAAGLRRAVRVLPQDRRPGFRRASWNAARRIAALHRRRLRTTVFVGITGSCGKTTAKELAAAVLARRGPVVASPGSLTSSVRTALTLLDTRRRHAACVVELGVFAPGTLDRSLAILRPSIGVVLAVGTDHWRSFHSKEAIAAEKGKLVAALPPEGTAVLNADDPLVAGMAELCPGRVLRVGVAPDADLRAEDVRAAWPERLSFRAVHGGRAVAVRTRLVGRQHLPAVLAALGVGLAAGVPLEEAAEAVAAVPPLPLRMEPVELPGGVTILRDDYKAPWWSLPAALACLAEARVKRRVAVIGTISVDGGPGRGRYRELARLALDAAELVVLVGPNARHVMPGRRRSLDDGPLRAFPTARDAARFLERELQPGDLVLFKGTHRADHLERLILSRAGPAACWRTWCRREISCDRCELLHVPESAPHSL
jgi:UDP-N-acetylmuramyl pentapeptide synthase